MGGLHAEKLTQREMPSKNNKLVKGKIPLPSFCFDYQGKPLLALIQTFPMMYLYLLRGGGG